MYFEKQDTDFEVTANDGVTSFSLGGKHSVVMFSKEHQEVLQIG
jgi:hypothetical protein